MICSLLPLVNSTEFWHRVKATHKQACDLLNIELTQRKLKLISSLKFGYLAYFILFSYLLLYLHCAFLREDEDVIITDVLQVSTYIVLYNSDHCVLFCHDPLSHLDIDASSCMKL